MRNIGLFRFGGGCLGIELFKNGISYAVGTFQDFVAVKPEHFYSIPDKDTINLCFLLFSDRMIDILEIDNQVGVLAIETHDIAEDSFLALEFEAVELALLKHFPQGIVHRVGADFRIAQTHLLEPLELLDKTDKFVIFVPFAHDDDASQTGHRGNKVCI